MRCCPCPPSGQATGRALTRHDHGPPSPTLLGVLELQSSKALFSPTDYLIRNQRSSLCPHQHQVHLPLLGGTTTLPVPMVDPQSRPGLVGTAFTAPSHLVDSQPPHSRLLWVLMGKLVLRAPISSMAVSWPSVLPKATLCPRTKQAVSSAQLVSTYGPIWKLDHSSAMGTSTQDLPLQ